MRMQISWSWPCPFWILMEGRLIMAVGYCVMKYSWVDFPLRVADFTADWQDCLTSKSTLAMRLYTVLQQGLSSAQPTCRAEEWGKEAQYKPIRTWPAGGSIHGIHRTAPAHCHSALTISILKHILERRFAIGVTTPRESR